MRSTFVAGVKWLLGISLALALAAGGCNNGDGSAARTTVPTAPSTTTTTTPTDPYAVPATIDESYVQGVLQKLYEIEVEAVSSIVKEQELTPTAVDILRSVYHLDELNAQLRVWNAIIEDRELSMFRDNPEAVVVKEIELGRADPRCIELKTVDDPNAAAAKPAELIVSYLVLRPKIASADPPGRNPTPWMIAYESTTPEDARCG